MTVSKAREISQNRFQVRDSGRVDDEGKEVAAVYDDKG
jgi:hypothetical protein